MIKIFSFHRVHSERDSLWDPVSPELFEKIIHFLSRKYTIINLEQYLDNVSNYSASRNIACIVFDDGYKDNIDFALPILEKYEVYASFYIVTDCIDKQQLTWTHALAYSFQNTTKKLINLKSYDFIPIYLQSSTWKNELEKLQFAGLLKKYLKSVTDEQRKSIISELQKQFDDVQQPTNLMMNWDDVRLLIKMGHCVGSHTVTHGLLGKMEKESDIMYELEYSAKRIQEETGIFPKTISYPVGSYNKNVIRIAQEIGYLYGLAVKQKFYYPEKDNIFAIPRVELYNESFFKTKLRISGQLEFIKKFIRL